VLHEKVILLQKKGFVLYDLTGRQMAAFKKLVNLGHELVAVSNGKKFALARLDGSLITQEIFDSVTPFAEGLAIAKKGKEFTAFAPDATIAFTLQGIDGMRGFCNGYAVIKKGRKYGAIDTKGNTALTAKWTWLRDCAYDAFVFSKAIGPSDQSTLGLVMVGDHITIPCKYHNLEQVDGNFLKFGKVITKEYVDGNTRYIKRIFAFGLLDYAGNEIVPWGITSIGEEGDGMHAYARYLSDTNVEFGYLNSQWKRATLVANINKIPRDDVLKFGITQVKEFIFDYKLEDLLFPFYKGKALVMLSADGRLLEEGRWIDKTGMEKNSGQKPPRKEKPDSTGDKADKEAIKQIVESLGDQFAPLPFPLPTRKSCRRLGGDIWEIVSSTGDISFGFSKLESINEFSCGLMAVMDESSGKTGFVNHEGNMVVAAKYDDAKPFSDNRTWARLGNEHFILKREMRISS
jgi:hypothetical protein